MSRPRIRCAIYTCKSSDEGLDQDFNSLDAQHEACAAYIASQRHEGWVAGRTRYDDGGVSGGTLDRPGLQRLLADIDAGLVQIVVVYKIDRLTRSLADFAKLVERLDSASCSFVSVTQAFNTTSSMGRLTLNVLLSFAQFEREVTAERIRDKIAASKKKGLWMGGVPPLGYDPHPDPKTRGLVVNAREGETVRSIFSLYDDLGCLNAVMRKSVEMGLRSKRHHFTSGRSQGGNPFSRGQIYALLRNPIYIGKIRHKSQVWDGQHDAIIDTALWDRVQAKLQAASARPRSRDGSTKIGHKNAAAPLTGKLRDETGDRLTPTHTKRHGRRLRYYISNRLISGSADSNGWRLPGSLTRAGLVATNSIRGGPSREVLKPIVNGGRIFDAWSDEEWTVDGAAVRVSLVCFDTAKGGAARLDSAEVAKVFSDLTASATGTNLTNAARLDTNKSLSFMGVTKSGPFDLDGDTARKMLAASGNPHGRSNRDVLKRSVNGVEIVRRRTDRWILDFGPGTSLQDAALYERPFSYAETVICPARQKSKAPKNREYWWLFERHRPEMYAALDGYKRFIGTAMVAKHRMFAWLECNIVPENLVIVIARDDDTTFGILHSRFHELWALRLGTFLGVGNDPRYTPSTTFETFPFPEGLTPNIPAADYAADPRAQSIAAAADRLNELRENWLNPPDLVQRVPEVVPGYPDRILPKDDAAEAVLKKRTLTNLYNARPAWLAHAHAALDEAVAEAYGWGDDWRAGLLTDDEILARLFRLNQDRAAAQAKAKGAKT